MMPYFLLKNCFSISQLTYFLRSAPCFKNKEMLEKYDLLIKKTLQKILNVDLAEGGSKMHQVHYFFKQKQPPACDIWYENPCGGVF